MVTACGVYAACATGVCSGTCSHHGFCVLIRFGQHLHKVIVLLGLGLLCAIQTGGDPGSQTAQQDFDYRHKSCIHIHITKMSTGACIKFLTGPSTTTVATPSLMKGLQMGPSAARGGVQPGP